MLLLNLRICTTRFPSGKVLGQSQSLSEALCHRFNDPALLARALTHRSAGDPHNERFEFLGDAVLDTVISAELLRRFPAADEGQLTRMRASLVSGDSLAGIAADFGLGELLKLGTGERVSGGRKRRSILADTLEAVVGAVYLDAGFDGAQAAVLQCFGARLDECRPDDIELKDAKTRLQEFLQARGQPLPEYELAETTGPQHRQQFTVACNITSLNASVSAAGSSVKRAEQNAAMQALALLEERG